jgi:thioredoxin reductase (NADPH)
MQDRALNNPKIEMLWNTAVTEIIGKDHLESISLKNTVTGAESSMNVAGLFIAIGHRPNTDVFKGVIDMEDSGYLITRPDSTYTNIEGVFACGDVKDHVYRQAITAAGSGCMAAIDAERWLEQQH